MRVTVSVVVPTYNRAHLIGETLTAILAQERAPDEIIIVDDGSTDETAALVGSFDRVRYLPIENAGAQAARNAGVAAARSDWIAFCDSDDLWLPEHLSRHLALAAAWPYLGATFSDFETFDDTGAVLPAKSHSASAGWWEAAIAERAAAGWRLGGDAARALLAFFPCLPSVLMIRRGLYDRLAPRVDASRGEIAEDLELVLRAALAAPIGAIPHVTARLREHPGCLSRHKTRQLAGEARRLARLRGEGDAGFAGALEGAIAERARAAAHAAFADRDWALFQAMAGLVPADARDPKLRLKRAILSLPGSAGSKIASALLRS